MLATPEWWFILVCEWEWLSVSSSLTYMFYSPRMIELCSSSTSSGTPTGPVARRVYSNYLKWAVVELSGRFSFDKRYDSLPLSGIVLSINLSYWEPFGRCTSGKPPPLAVRRSFGNFKLTLTDLCLAPNIDGFLLDISILPDPRCALYETGLKIGSKQGLL